MKKFHHKLDSLIKYYTFLEYQSSVELGKINRKMQDIKNEIERCKKDVSLSLLSQESFGISQKTVARQIQLIPLVVKDLRDYIDYLVKELNKLMPEYEKKLKDLHEKKSKLDLVTNIRERAVVKNKKEYLNKMNEELLEIVIQNKMFNSNDI